tara:strand:+ start:897 stop:1526 length:630 start_codon:yes stop_codon:yes gene_type:complete
MMNDYDYSLKFIMVGNPGVGKSTLIEKYINNRFVSPNDITIGVEYNYKIVNIDNKKIKIELWDTAGQERFNSIVQSYYRNAIGAFVVYDISNRLSYNALPRWVRTLDKVDSNIRFKVLIGNKSDVLAFSQVNKLEGEQVAKKFNFCAFYETSAKDGRNIEDIFENLTKIIKEKIDNGELSLETKGIKSRVINLDSHDENEKGYFKCCFL